MKVKQLRLRNFMSYVMGEKHVSIDLPDSGIILITGGNGAGKSTLIEAVSAAVYGKILRGTPWHNDAAEVSSVECIVERGDHDLVLRRTRKNKRGTTKLEIDGAPDYDSKTKAQAYVDAVLPSFDVWKKTSVFSSAAIEGDHFTDQTDANRKRLIEALLDLNKFDVAAQECRKDIKRLDRTLLDAEHKWALLDGQYNHSTQRAKDAADARNRLQVPVKPSSCEALEAEEEKAQTEVDLQASDLEDLEDQLRAGESRIQRMREDLGKMEAGDCKECGRPWKPGDLDSARAALLAAVGAWEPVREKLKKSIRIVRGLLEDAKEDVYSLGEQLRDNDVNHAAYEDALAEEARLDAIVRDETLAATRKCAERSEVNVARTDLRSKLAVLLPTERVLGLKGVRTHILTHTLAGLTAVTNKRLSQMGSSITVEINPFAEKKDGGTSDSIGVVVHGAGGGHGYNACSVGQRRRIDVAIILALATMAGAVHGVSGGTLFFDEVFDVLDAAGVAGVVAILEQLSRDRCIVVVSHSDELVGALDPAVHLHVENGSILEL